MDQTREERGGATSGQAMSAMQRPVREVTDRMCMPDGGLDGLRSAELA